MEVSDGLGPAGKRDVDGAGGGEFLELFAADGFLAFAEGFFQFVLEGVGSGTKGGPLLLRLVLDRAQEQGDAAVLASEPFGAPLFEAGFVRLLECGEAFFAQGIDGVAHGDPL